MLARMVMVMQRASVASAKMSGSRTLVSLPAAARAASSVLPASVLKRSSGIFRPGNMMIPGARVTRSMHQSLLVRAVASSAGEATSGTETFTYQAEVDRFMDIIVHSLYSNREVFVRELVSNASDALDKMRLTALQDPEQYKSGSDLEIRIKADKEAGTLTIEDSGIGMTREELLSSLGTIARSGTKKFMEAMKDKHDANLIGQFGVGFYSAFLVADRVSVETKSNEDGHGWIWEGAAGAHDFTIRQAPEDDLARGTRITLHLKPDATEFADSGRVKSLLKQYSEFISFPIQLWTSETVNEQVLDADATTEAQAAADALADKEGAEKKTVDPVFRTESKSVEGWKVQNDNKPLWTRSPRDVTREEQNAFFKATFKEFMDPAAVSQFNVEGTLEFSGLLFIPGIAPFDQSTMMGKPRNIRLYVRRVFISDAFDEDLLPRWAGFVKGIVDSADLPLNVSREILQENRIVRAIRKQLEKRTLDMLNELANSDDKEAYARFWDNFGRFLKIGILDDASNKAAVSKLLRFKSSASGDGLISLSDYVSRMKDSQKDIYFLITAGKDAAESAPYVEALTGKGYEVLYLNEAVDELVVLNLTEFEGKKFADVTREDLDLEESEDAKKESEAAQEELKDLLGVMKSVLGERVEKVVASKRLTDSPAIVVLSKFGWSTNMERIARAQAMNDPHQAEYMRGRRILEVNPNHAIIKAMRGQAALDSAELRDEVELLYDTALLAGGYEIESPRDFATRIYELLSSKAGVASTVEAEVVSPSE